MTPSSCPRESWCPPRRLRLFLLLLSFMIGAGQGFGSFRLVTTNTRPSAQRLFSSSSSRRLSSLLLTPSHQQSRRRGRRWRINALQEASAGAATGDAAAGDAAGDDDGPEISRSYYHIEDDKKKKKTNTNNTDATTLQLLPPQLLQQLGGGIDWIKNKKNREILAICTIYFVEGALGLSRLAQSYLLKDELHLGPAELSALTGLFVLPWTIKPLYGFLSDGVPLFNYRRKSYLIVAGILGGLSYAVLSYEPFWRALSPTTSISGTVAALLLGSACIAFSDVVADGMVVTRTREYAVAVQAETAASADAATTTTDDDPAAMAGGLQSLCWGAASLGGLVSAYFSGSLLQVMPPRAIFAITAVLPFLVALIAFGVDETPVTKSDHRHDNNNNINDDSNNNNIMGDSVKDQVALLWATLRMPSIWKPTLFLFLWQSTPTADGAFFYFLTNDLQLGPEFLGRVRLVTAFAGLLGVFLYNQYLKRVEIKDILYWSTIASVPLGLLPVLLITHVNREWGIPDTMLIYGDDVVLAVLGQISFLPTLVLAARLCPPGVEAVLFATLMSIFNGAGTVGTELGALLTKAAGITETNFDNLAALTVFCNLTTLWPLLLIGWLDGIAGKDVVDGVDEGVDEEDKKREKWGRQ